MKTVMQSSVVFSVLLFALCFPMANAGSKNPREDAESIKLVEKASVRFEGKLTSRQFASFRDSLSDLSTDLKKVDKVAASELVYKYARASDTRSRVAISTSNGSGASIRYQTLGQRSRNEIPTTAKGLTELTEQMYIGRYYIWAVRNGRVTSDQNSEFQIVDATETVKLQEK